MSNEVTDLTKGVYRRLYAGFIKGQRINRLSLQAEAWFWRVLASADDFGNADADPGLCLAATVGRRKGISVEKVAAWLEEMRESGLIQFYAKESEKYLHIVGFEELQPAGKNGRRVQRFPLCESEGIQGDPDVVSASYSYSDPYSDNHTDPYSDNDPERADAPFFSAEFQDALAGFEKHRKEKRASLTPTARRNLFKKLAALGEERAIAALIYSTEQGYTGCFEANSNGTRKAASKVDNSMAAVRRVIQEYEQNEH
jgi:hypothetical protein